MLDNEKMETVSRVARNLAPHFLFGAHTVEDLVQEAHLWIAAGDRLADWNPDRGTLWTFTKRILWNRFCNLKRDQWERRDRPCHTCVLAEYCSKSDNCSLFDDKAECDLWRAWHERNERKKSLQRQDSLGSDPESGGALDPGFETFENQEFFAWCLTRVEDPTGLKKYLEGEQIGSARLERIILDIQGFIRE